jgi:hypothetical protein
MPKKTDDGINLIDFINNAQRQLGFTEHFTPGFDDPKRMAAPAIASTRLKLNQLIPDLASLSRDEYPITVRPAGQKIRLGEELLLNSCVAQFGAQVVLSEGAPVEAKDGIPLLYSRNQKFRVVKPGIFSEAADGAEIVASSYPVSNADATMADAPSSALRFTLARAGQKQITDDQLAYEILTAVGLGLAREADRVLTAAILATTPAEFTPGLAAAAGLRFKGLRALVGTAGTGAFVEDGKLTASGIDGELTDVMTQTIIGAWENSAVFVHDDIHLIMKRTNAEGTLEVSIFVNMKAAVPDPSMFWLGVVNPEPVMLYTPG